MQETTLQETGMKKTYMCVWHMVYIQLVQKLFDLFKGKESEKCALNTFIKYKKPFLVTSLTKKGSCLCKRCLNMHLL